MKKTSFIQKVGSNFQIKDRTVFLSHAERGKPLNSGIFGGECVCVGASRRPHFGF